MMWLIHSGTVYNREFNLTERVPYGYKLGKRTRQSRLNEVNEQCLVVKQNLYEVVV